MQLPVQQPQHMLLPVHLDIHLMLDNVSHAQLDQLPVQLELQLPVVLDFTLFLEFVLHVPLESQPVQQPHH